MQTRKGLQRIRATLGRQVSRRLLPPTRCDLERHSPGPVVSLQLTTRAPAFLPHPAIRREMMDLTQGRDRVSGREPALSCSWAQKARESRRGVPRAPYRGALPCIGRRPGTGLPRGVHFPRGAPTSCLQTEGEGREPQNSPARPPRHPPGPGRAAPSRPPAEPGAGAGPGSGFGLLRPLPAPGGALRRLCVCRSRRALSGTAAASGAHRTTFLSPAKCVGAARTWRASARAERTEGAGWTRDEGRSPGARAQGGAYRRGGDQGGEGSSLLEQGQSLRAWLGRC